MRLTITTIASMCLLGFSSISLAQATPPPAQQQQQQQVEISDADKEAFRKVLPTIQKLAAERDQAVQKANSPAEASKVGQQKTEEMREEIDKAGLSPTKFNAFASQQGQ